MERSRALFLGEALLVCDHWRRHRNRRRDADCIVRLTLGLIIPFFASFIPTKETLIAAFCTVDAGGTNQRGLFGLSCLGIDDRRGPAEH